MEENRKIILSTGDISLGPELGIYYIDMRPAMIHYTNNIWGGGFDQNRVPMCAHSDGTLYYSPVNIAQFGFMLHADYLETKDSTLLKNLKNCLDVLESCKTERKNYAVWYNDFFNSKYKINPPWASAMAQGEIISLYLRMYQITNDENLLNTAIKAYRFLKVDFKDGGVRRYDEEGNLWFEEYPSEPPSFVLNGFIYTVFGLFDLYRITNDPDVKKEIDTCMLTLKKNIHKFDSGYWSNYDLLKKELVRYYYQKNVHVPQLDVLYRLTGDYVFKKYSNKWQRTLNPINFIFVQIMYRVKPRFQRLFNI